MADAPDPFHIPDLHELPPTKYADDHLGVLQRLVDQVDLRAMATRSLYRNMASTDYTPEQMGELVKALGVSAELDEKVAALLRDFSRMPAVAKALSIPLGPA